MKGSGKTTNPGAIQHLNLPRPAAVEEKEGTPCGIRLIRTGNPKSQVRNSKLEARNPGQYRNPNSKGIKVASIEDCWRIDDEWWREKPVSRLYFEVLLEDGRRLTVFKDLLQGQWYRQKVTDIASATAIE